MAVAVRLVLFEKTFGVRPDSRLSMFHVMLPFFVLRTRLDEDGWDWGLIEHV